VVGGCGSNEGCGVGSSCNKVKANDMCAQDLSNAQSVDAPVAGSLSVRNCMETKTKGEKESGTVNRVRAKGSPTKSGKWKVKTEDKPTSNSKPGVRMRGKTTKSKSNSVMSIV